MLFPLAAECAYEQAEGYSRHGRLHNPMVWTLPPGVGNLVDADANRREPGETQDQRAGSGKRDPMDAKGAQALVERLQLEQRLRAAREEFVVERAPQAHDRPQSAKRTSAAQS
jgi:hypothetical protein